MSIQRIVLLLACALFPFAATGATIQLFLATLNGSSESPPTPSAGSGNVEIVYTPGTLMMEVKGSFAGLTSYDTAAHIHCCITSPSTNAGVATTTPSFPGFPLGVMAGTFDGTLDMNSAASYNPAFVTANGDVAGARNTLLTGMRDGTAYFNIHTTNYPGGEIRGTVIMDTVFADGFD